MVFLNLYGKNRGKYEMVYGPMLENYIMKTTSLVDNFLSPTDAVLIDNHIFVIECGHNANIW
jgi:hypothetical protein